MKQILQIAEGLKILSEYVDLVSFQDRHDEISVEVLRPVLPHHQTRLIDLEWRHYPGAKFWAYSV